MRSSMVLGAALAALMFVGLAPAQPPGGGRGGFGMGGFGGFGGGLAFMIRSSKAVQDELKMDKEQVDKLTEAMNKLAEESRETMRKLFDATPEERTEIMKKMSEANTKAVESVLKPEQIKRYHQLENQQAGIGMYTKPDVQKALKLTDDQKGKIESINSALQKDMRELGGGRGGFGGGAGGPGGFGRPDPQTQKKREALVKEATEKIMDVLEDNQRTLVKDLTGETFDFSKAFAGGFGAGGGGFGGAGGGFGGFRGVAPGQLLPTFLQDQLKLTDEQKKAVEALQKETDEKLQKILTEEQNKQLKDMRNARPGGFGGGRPGGPPGGGPDR